MSDVEAGETEAVEAAAPVVVEKKAKAARGGMSKPSRKDKVQAKTVAVSAHPKYSKMIADAIVSLKERSGSSRQAIVKYILTHYEVGKDERTVNSHVKMSLRASIKNGSLKQSKGVGASGSFRIGEKAKGEKKPAKKASPSKEVKPLSKVKKPKAAKAKKPAKVEKSTPKKSSKKVKSPKKSPKAAKAKSPKKSKSPKAAKGKKAVKKAKAEESAESSDSGAAAAVESS